MFPIKVKKAPVEIPPAPFPKGDRGISNTCETGYIPDKPLQKLIDLVGVLEYGAMSDLKFNTWSAGLRIASRLACDEPFGRELRVERLSRVESRSHNYITAL